MLLINSNSLLDLYIVICYY